MKGQKQHKSHHANIQYRQLAFVWGECCLLVNLIEKGNRIPQNGRLHTETWWDIGHQASLEILTFDQHLYDVTGDQWASIQSNMTNVAAWPQNCMDGRSGFYLWGCYHEIDMPSPSPVLNTSWILTHQTIIKCINELGGCFWRAWTIWIWGWE